MGGHGPEGCSRVGGRYEMMMVIKIEVRIWIEARGREVRSWRFGYICVNSILP